MNLNHLPEVLSFKLIPTNNQCFLKESRQGRTVCRKPTYILLQAPEERQVKSNPFKQIFWVIINIKLF
jgi:hypothetical protein